MTDYSIDEWRLDIADERLWRGRSAVKLTPKSFSMLRYLASRPNCLVTKKELLANVWARPFVSEALVKDYIRDLRRVFDDDARRPQFIETVHGRGYRFIGRLVLEGNLAGDGNGEAGTGPRPSRATAVATLGKATIAPVIAVLPFENLCAEPRWDLIVDGLVEDIVTDLSRYPDLRVVARRSTAIYKQRTTDARAIGRELGATYLLSGSVQAIDAEVRIRVELIDNADGTLLWSDRVKGHTNAVFAFMDTVTERVATSLSGFHGEIHRAERVKFGRRPPSSFEAYELYLLGYECETKFDLANTIAGRAYLERAVALDPSFSRAWTILGWLCNNAVGMRLVDDLDELRARGREAVVRAYELDPRDPLAIIERGALSVREGDLTAARTLFERAADIGANDVDASVLLAKYTALVVGRVDDAMALIARAFELNPRAPDWYYLQTMRVAFFAGRFEGVLEAQPKAPVDVETCLLALLASRELEALDDVRAAAANFVTRYPDFDVELLIDTVPLVLDEQIAAYRASLAKAGLRPVQIAPILASNADAVDSPVTDVCSIDTN